MQYFATRDISRTLSLPLLALDFHDPVLSVFHDRSGTYISL